jgi:hypothetical protein
MRIALVIIFGFVSLFGQTITFEEDFIDDTIIQSPLPNSDTTSPKPRVVPDKTSQTPPAANQNKIRFYGEAAVGSIWNQYENLLQFWHYAFRIGCGISGGVVVNLTKPFRLRTGLRLYQSGNKMDISGDFYHVNYDTVTWEPVDSQLVHWKGYFRLTQYYVSIPVFIDIFLKDIPVYIISGFEPGYLMYVSSYSELFEDGNKRPSAPESNERSYYKDFNYVIHNGIGFQFCMKKRYRSELQVVFAWGLFPIGVPDKWVEPFRTRELSLRYLLSI